MEIDQCKGEEWKWERNCIICHRETFRDETEQYKLVKCGILGVMNNMNFILCTRRRCMIKFLKEYCTCSKNNKK